MTDKDRDTTDNYAPLWIKFKRTLKKKRNRTFRPILTFSRPTIDRFFVDHFILIAQNSDFNSSMFNFVPFTRNQIMFDGLGSINHPFMSIYYQFLSNFFDLISGNRNHSNTSEIFCRNKKAETHVPNYSCHNLQIRIEHKLLLFLIGNFFYDFMILKYLN